MTLKLAVVGRRQGLVLSVVILLFNLVSQVLCSSAPDCHNNSLPGLVDLGYSKHVPGWHNTTGSGKRVTVYRNIRFAKPPTGDLRFRKPDTNLPHEDGIQDGLYPWLGTDCIASAPIYVPFPGVAGTAWGHEDCLFLDVWVPEGVKPGDNVPVIHWYFGSAYAFGSKDISFNSIGLFDRADEDQKFIFVTNNYRLGLPGWTYLPGQDMDANVGLHDCLAATEWTAKYIDRFGGDPNRITVIGQSAGAGIINLLTVLRGGKGKVPFQQAFISSPDVPPRRHPLSRQRELFQSVLNATNCTELKCLRSVPEEVILTANNNLINFTKSDAGGGLYGMGVGFGPVPDGNDIPDMPRALYEQGEYHKELGPMIVGTMAKEGEILSDDVDMPARFPTIVREVIPGASNETIAKIQALYSNLSQPEELAWDWVTDMLFACNAYNLDQAYPEKTSRYIMSLPPAVHGLDGEYYLYVNQTYTPVSNPELAIAFQKRLLSFVHGNTADWPTWGNNEEFLNITAGGFELTQLPSDMAHRCEVLNTIFLDPKNGV